MEGEEKINPVYEFRCECRACLYNLYPNCVVAGVITIGDHGICDKFDGRQTVSNIQTNSKKAVE
jgi:hypothetical protein